MVAHLLWDRLSRNPVQRVVEPEGVMLDPAQNRAFAHAGARDGTLAFLYLYHAAQIASVARPGDTVLDLACGPAHELALAAQLAPQARFVGVDASPPMLEMARDLLARRDIQNASVEDGDMTALARWNSASVDVVTCTMSLHHLPDAATLERAMREMRRILKPGGGVYVADFGRLRRRSSQRYFTNDWRREQTPEFTQDFASSLAAAFSVEELTRAASEAGLPAARHVTPLGPFVVVFRSAARALTEECRERFRAMYARLDATQRRRFEVFSRWLDAGGCELPVAS